MSLTFRQILWIASMVMLFLFMLLTLIVCFPLFVLTSTISLVISSGRMSTELFRRRSDLDELKASFTSAFKCSPPARDGEIILSKSDYVVKERIT